MSFKHPGLVLVIVGALFTASNAQPVDTILTFNQARAGLIKHNLGILAAYYDVDMARAQVIQARAWNNPQFRFDGELKNTQTGEWFAVRNQYAMELEQTFSIAGKHTHNVRLARAGAAVAEKQFEDVVRCLLYELALRYNDLAALQEKQKLYDGVLRHYDKLLEATRHQLSIGAMPITESVRLEAEYRGLWSAAQQNLSQKEAAASELRALLRLRPDTVFYVEQRLPPVGADLVTATLVELALRQRPDLSAARLRVAFQEENLKLQKSTSIPDLTVSIQPYDKASNYTSPYHGFSTAFALPVFDRNKGRIRQAHFAIQQSELQLDQLELEAGAQVTAACARYRLSMQGLARYDNTFLQQLEDLNRSSDANFQQHLISLLQFIDHQRIYLLTHLQLIDLRREHLDHINELNFRVGQNYVEIP